MTDKTDMTDKTGTFARWSVHRLMPIARIVLVAVAFLAGGPGLLRADAHGPAL